MYVRWGIRSFLVMSSVWAVLLCCCFSVCEAAGARAVQIAALDSALARVSVAVLKEAYGRLELPVRITYLPPERSIQVANNGTYDAEAHRIAGVDKKYPNLLMVDVPIAIMWGCVFTVSVVPKQTGWKGLESHRIGYWMGTKFFEKGVKKLHATLFYSQREMFEALHRGRIELGLASYLSGKVALKHAGITDVHAIEPALQSVPLYHYVHRSNAELVPRLEKVLKEMYLDGSIQKIWATTEQRMLQ